MKALVFDGQLQLRSDYPLPQIQEGEALIELKIAGICNTDLEITRGFMDFKGVLGHEFVGIVKDVGSKEDKDWVGQRVVGDINVACRRCAVCLDNRPTHCPHRSTLGIYKLDGAFADYLKLPVANLVKVSENITDEEAVFIEPLAAACEVLEQLHIQPTARVLIIGDGKLGLLICQTLQLTGAEVVVLGRHAETKGALVESWGIPYFIDPAKLIAPFDIVVECTGNQEGLARAQQLVRARGKIVLKSTYHGRPDLPLSQYVIDEITLLGSRCGPFLPAMRLLQHQLVHVKPLISAVYNLEEGLLAFEKAFAKGQLKVLMKM